ncbi:unnamed protein product [Clavelina lepadiformis]|uniref:inositol-polyphosphate 5-phosphatase n=1 Tax=Clavelina lepadiformis TaxID=159417 RepID=A0ABP0GAV3_CLALP
MISEAFATLINNLCLRFRRSKPNMASNKKKYHPKLNCLIVTANVGTLFEDPEGIQDAWIGEVTKVVKKHEPNFIALHCQEIGGKDYKSSLDPVNAFFKKFIDHDELADFSVVRGYLDGDYDHIDQYTALGNFYFIHKSLENVTMFDYSDKQYVKVSGKEIVSKDLSSLPNIQKEKFEQNFFPDCKWSRKGYSRARWRINNKVIEFVNIHLFHDDSNLVSMKSTPSPYTSYRKRALKFVMQRLKELYPTDEGVCFICGDFNFRLDVKSLVQKLCPSSKQQVVRAPTDDEIIRILIRDNVVNGSADDVKGSNEVSKDEVVLKIEKKVFEIEHSLLHHNSNYEHLRSFDLEPKDWKDQLKEFDINFPPTYPFSEDTSKSDVYMETRCPSWCDRVLLSNSSWDWLQSEEIAPSVTYSTIGQKACMGDHKPVYLFFSSSLADDDSVATSSGVNGSETSSK